MARTKSISVDQLPLVAIDLGSSGVKMLAARKREGDIIEILGVEQSNRFPCVEYGIITQTSNAGYMIVESLKHLANRINEPQLPTAFVCVGGRQMKTVQVSASRDLVRKKEISQELLDTLYSECKQKIEEHNDDVCVLGLVPIYYVVDKQEQETSPIGQRAALIEAHYTAFVAPKKIEMQMNKSFGQAGRSIEQTFVRQEALLSAFAAEDGAQIYTQGCAVIDMGAQTTTLSVYKGTQYLETRVIPQGGYHITRVIEDQGISFEAAEKLKCRCGYAAADYVERNFHVEVPSANPEVGRLRISGEELAYLINLKLEEIINPLMEIINRYASRIRTVYITGGASMLQGMLPYIQQKTPVQVLYGAHDALLSRGTNPEYCAPIYSALIGTILMGADYRDAHPHQVVKPTQMDNFKTKITDLFS